MLNQIASALHRKDEAPNVQLADKLAASQNSKGISEIVSGLWMDKATANDCIKVLYEIGEQNPALIVPHVGEFLNLLKSRNNRLVWGAMTALAHIAGHCPKKVFERWKDVYAAFETGSVITVDNSISVFAILCTANPEYERTVLPVLLNHFANCRAKEIPQHLERTSICVTPCNAEQFQSVVQKRYNEMTKSQQARVNKILKKIDLSCK